MAAKKKAAKAGAAAVAVKNSPVRPARRRGRGAAREPRAGLRVRARRRRPPRQRQVADEADLRRQEAAEGPQERRRVVPRRVRRAARGAQAAQGPELRPAAPADRRQRRRRARGVRGPAQEGARRAVRRRGGVRVHLDDHDAARAGERAGDRRRAASSAPSRAPRRTGSSGMSQRIAAATKAAIPSDRRAAMPSAFCSG